MRIMILLDVNSYKFMRQKKRKNIRRKGIVAFIVNEKICEYGVERVGYMLKREECFRELLWLKEKK